MSKNVLNFLSEETFSESASQANEYLRAIAAGVGAGYIPKSFKEIQELVRTGRHKQLLHIGDQYSCMKSGKELVWDVIGIDNDIPADPQYEHSLTILLHNIYDYVQFDAPEAMYYAEEELPSGTYNVTLTDGWSGGMGNGKTYQFTLSKPVPANGQIVWNGSYNQDPLNYQIKTYSDSTSTVVIESVSPTEGSEGLSLTKLNNAKRMCYGSNNYKTSAIRQFINSDKVAGSVWIPQHNYDRPPSWASNKNGFLYEMDSDLLDVVGISKKITANMKSIDGDGYYELKDKFFLLSRSEIYANNEYSDVNEGDVYPYFKNYSDSTQPGTSVDSNRIKYINGNPYWWWLRTPSSGIAYIVRGVYRTGELSGNVAYGTYGLVVACTII